MSGRAGVALSRKTVFFIPQGPLRRVYNLSSPKVLSGPGLTSRERDSLNPRTRPLPHEGARLPIPGVGGRLHWFLGLWTSLVHDK